MVLVLENSPLDYESGNRQGNPADQFLTSSDVQMKGKMWLEPFSEPFSSYTVYFCCQFDYLSSSLSSNRRILLNWGILQAFLKLSIVSLIHGTYDCLGGHFFFISLKQSGQTIFVWIYAAILIFFPQFSHFFVVFFILFFIFPLEMEVFCV